MTGMTGNGAGRSTGGSSFAAGIALSAMLFGKPVLAECPRDAAGEYADARRAFDEKRFDDSVTLLRRAYACDPKAIYLGNVARAYEEANRPRDALAAWRDYLAVISDERERSVTEGRISALTKIVEDLDRLEREKEAAVDAQRKAEAQAQTHRTEPPPPEAAPSRHVSTGAWITVVAGASGLVAGGVLGVLAISKHNAAVADPNAVSAAGTQSDATTFAQGANWAWVIGGAVTALGVTWMAVDLLRPTTPTPSGALALVVRGASVAVTGHF
jgi:hypothetical protein